MLLKTIQYLQREYNIILLALFRIQSGKFPTHITYYCSTVKIWECLEYLCQNMSDENTIIPAKPICPRLCIMMLYRALARIEKRPVPKI